MTCLSDAFLVDKLLFLRINAGTPDKIANDCTFYAEGGAWVIVFN